MFHLHFLVHWTGIRALIWKVSSSNEEDDNDSDDVH